jgi:hypothetical protein
MTTESYDNWRRSQDCGTKRRYTYAEATRRAREPYKDGRPRRAYRCAFCGHYHVGRTRGFTDRNPNEWPRGGGIQEYLYLLYVMSRAGL